MNTYTTYIFDEEVTIQYAGRWVSDYAHNVPSHYEVHNIYITKDGAILDLPDGLIHMAEQAVITYEGSDES